MGTYRSHEESTDMTAYARWADSANRLHRAASRLASTGHIGFLAKCWITLIGCVLLGSIGRAQGPVIVEDGSLPAALGTRFEDSGQHTDSVLVQDGAHVRLPSAPEITAAPLPSLEFDVGSISESATARLEESLDGPGIQITDAGPVADDWWTGCTTAFSNGMNWVPGGCGPQCHHGGPDACGLDGRCRRSHDTWGHGGNCYGKPCCHGGCRPGCLWALEADALVLWRNNIAGQPLLVDDVGAVALDAGDVHTAAAAGPRIGLVRSVGCGRAVELSYFNVGGIQGSTATTATGGGTYTPVGLADIAFADIEEAEYTSRGQIKSLEFNYRWCQGRRVIWLAGARWVEWNELASVDMQPSGDAIQTRAGNDLYGGQFGCRLRLWDLGKWQFTGVGKAGAFGNTSYQRTIANIGVDEFGPLGADDTGIAFFGEIGFNSTLWLTEWLAWRAGYNFFWLEGVATAPQQFPLVNYGSDTASINTNGSVFLQGFSTGLEARW
jgi:hypothetical protein